MPQNDDWLTKRFGRSNDETPPEVPPQELELEPADGSSRMSAKPPQFITFVGGNGHRAGFSYSHLYNSMTTASGFELEFSDHRVQVVGRGLVTPEADCLLTQIEDHKRRWVRVTPRAEFEDGPVVTDIHVTRIKAG